MKHTTTPNGIDCLFVIPDLALVELDHDVKGASGSVFIGILQQTLDEVLEFLVDSVVLGFLVQLLEVVDDGAVKELTQLFVLASEKLEENWKDDRWGHDVLAPHNLQAGDQGHSDLRVQDGIVLLQEVKDLCREEIRKLLPVDSRNVCHEF